ncbi:MAG: 3-hydroxyacyl-CoA dehydrogenase NAD-binding domain-containing protein, partial [Planctomycetota bacterium]
PSALPLLGTALSMVRSEQTHGQYLANRQRWSKPITISETELTFLGATASGVIQQKTGGHYPAPLAALELMLEASMLDLDAALELEAERFAPLFGSPVNRALLNVFFLTDRAKKTEVGRKPAPLSRIGVVGAGTMGRGIAAATARRGVGVTLCDSRADALADGVSAVVTEAAYDRELKGPSADRAADLAALVDASIEPAALGAADLVVEAIFEDAAAKRDLFAKIEPHAGDETILCSNTSTIPISTLAEGLARPDRFCGLHFFNPVRKMPLVEVIRGSQTSDETIARATAFARQIGKTPVVVADGPGFLVNRLLMPYLGEATRLVEEGVPIRDIEKAAKRFGMPMGPITLQDVVGLDVCLHAGRVMRQAFPDRVLESPLIAALVDAGRLGQKSGKGFFDYPPAKPGKPPKGADSAEVVRIRNAACGGQSDTRAERVGSITDRLLLPMLVEATRAIEDGIVRDARELDLAMILGVGFPPFRGGLLFWADTVGAAAIAEKLRPLEALGPRYEVTGLLAEAAKANASFYSLLNSSR